MTGLPLFDHFDAPPTRPKHDPGGKVETALPPGMIGNAEFAGENQEHRLWLYRQWVGVPGAVPYALFIGMNPSTARADVNDPTITREVNFTKSWGFGACFKCNVGTYRSTDPDGLRNAEVPSHPNNIPTIRRLATAAAKVVLCYGVLPKQLQFLADQTIIALNGIGVELWCFGTTLRGHPRHPLYLAKDTDLVRFYPERREERP